MSTTVAALKIEQLRKELADAEAAQQVKKNLVSELAETEQAVTEAGRMVQLNKLRLTEETASLQQLSQEAAKIPQGMSSIRSKNDLQTQHAHQAIHALTVERDKLELDLGKKEVALGKIVDRIAENPAYRAAREKQRWFVAEATKLASTIFTVPLDEISSVLGKIAALADAEQGLLNGALGALRTDGLPDLKPVLARFVQEVTPDQILDALPGARMQVFQAVTKVKEQVSRPVQR
jgi:hypothetical protein